MMNWLENMLDGTIRSLELSGRARALTYLRQMDEELLREYGFAPEKVKLGIAAWPWQIDTADVAMPEVSDARVAALPTNADVQVTEADLPEAA